MHVDWGGEGEGKWGDECLVNWGIGERLVSKLFKTFSWTVDWTLTERAATSEVGSISQYFTTLSENITWKCSLLNSWQYVPLQFSKLFCYWAISNYGHCCKVPANIVILYISISLGRYPCMLTFTSIYSNVCSLRHSISKLKSGQLKRTTLRLEMKNSNQFGGNVDKMGKAKMGLLCFFKDIRFVPTQSQEKEPF